MAEMTVREAIQNMNHPNTDTRSKALQILNSCNKDCVPDILDAIRSDMERKGEYMVAFLMMIQREGDLTHLDVVPVLTDLITTTLNPIAQMDAVGILTQMYWKTKDESLFNHFLELLKNEHEGVRENVADALAELRDQRAIEPLIELLHSDNLSVILASIEALNEFKDNRAVPHLIRLLETGENLKSKDGVHMRVTLSEFVAETLKEYDSSEGKEALLNWQENQKL